MKRISTFKVIITALFAALVCVATMLVQIAIPATGGYANMGDGVILVCAFLIHPMCAVAAAGAGSMLADLLAGYASFAPGTLVIKAGVALIAAVIYGKFGRECSGKTSFISMIAAGVVAEAFMIAGYFFYEAVLLGVGTGAIAGVPGNAAQGAVGIIIGCAVSPVLLRSDEVKSMMKRSWY